MLMVHHISLLRDVTCHIGSHSVTCHPTEANAPRGRFLKKELWERPVWAPKARRSRRRRRRGRWGVGSRPVSRIFWPYRPANCFFPADFRL